MARGEVRAARTSSPASAKATPDSISETKGTMDDARRGRASRSPQTRSQTMRSLCSPPKIVLVVPVTGINL